MNRFARRRNQLFRRRRGSDVDRYLREGAPKQIPTIDWDKLGQDLLSSMFTGPSALPGFGSGKLPIRFKPGVRERINKARVCAGVQVVGQPPHNPYRQSVAKNAGEEDGAPAQRNLEGGRKQNRGLPKMRNIEGSYGGVSGLRSIVRVDFLPDEAVSTPSPLFAPPSSKPKLRDVKGRKGPPTKLGAFQVDFHLPELGKRPLETGEVLPLPPGTKRFKLSGSDEDEEHCRERVSFFHGKKLGDLDLQDRSRVFRPTQAQEFLARIAKKQVPNKGYSCRCDGWDLPVFVAGPMDSREEAFSAALEGVEGDGGQGGMEGCGVEFGPLTHPVFPDELDGGIRLKENRGRTNLKRKGSYGGDEGRRKRQVSRGN